MSVNKVILVGNVGQDPQIRYVESRAVASLSLATTDRAYTTTAGVQMPERTEWHNLVMWISWLKSLKSILEREQNYMLKGNCALAHGKIVMR